MYRLVAAMGLERGGVFLEAGGHDGEFESNSLYLEACVGFRGILIEPNPLSFGQLRRHRPDLLALRGAICRERGEVTFVAPSKGLADANRGGVESALDEQAGTG